MDNYEYNRQNESTESYELKQEQQRLKLALQAIHKGYEKAQRIVEGRREDVLDTRKYIWDDLVYDTDDWFEAAVNITQESRELARQAHSYSQAKQSAAKLERLMDSAYFGRLDFQEQHLQDTDRIYIGLSSFIDEDGEIWVYDWRAPISAMYYDYGPGGAQYRSPEGTVNGVIHKKRQFVIEGDNLRLMFDTGLAIGDDMLKEMLGKHADNKMKSIVTTIQREQNRIIRDTEHPILLVQGAAGSGKTSAAMQRVAYLLYKYRDRWTEDQLLLFSPNAVFNDYVSNVLPELGESNMQQTTFQEYVDRRLDSPVPLEDAYDQTEYVLSAHDDEPSRARITGISVKATAVFFAIVRSYVHKLAESGMLFKPFVAGEKLAIGTEKLDELFYGEWKQHPVPNRIARMREWCLAELDRHAEERMKRWFKHLQKQPKYIGSDQELRAMCKRKAKKVYGPLREQAKRTRFVDLRGLYIRLLEHPDTYVELSKKGIVPDRELWLKIVADTKARLETVIPFEDAAPMLLLQEEIAGFAALRRIKHVVIDEAQDYSPFQLLFFQRLFPNSGMTLLGDINQAILAQSPEQGHLTAEQLMGEDRTHTIRLTKSYRSTKEIVRFTNALLPNAPDAEPFERSGGKPSIIASDGKEAEWCASVIRSYLRRGYRSVAIICKTELESEQAHQMITQAGFTAHRISKYTREFVSGLTVVPSYLAKGLEFDAVLVYDASKEKYNREFERKLFYTVCTRALHELTLLYQGDISPFLGTVPAQLYREGEAVMMDAAAPSHPFVPTAASEA